MDIAIRAAARPGQRRLVYLCAVLAGVAAGLMTGLATRVPGRIPADAGSALMLTAMQLTFRSAPAARWSPR